MCSRRSSPPPSTRSSTTTARSTCGPGCTGSPATGASTTCAGSRPSASTRWTSICPTTARLRRTRSHKREEFRLLVGDIHGLPETQRTALVLREMDALSYEQIAEAMETTVPSVKSLLVRARVSLAEAAESRMLSCEEVRIELGEVAEGLRRRPSPLVRRHLRACDRCSSFSTQLRDRTRRSPPCCRSGRCSSSRSWPSSTRSFRGRGRRLERVWRGRGRSGRRRGLDRRRRRHGARRTTGGGFLSASVGAIATKAAAGLAAAALVTAGAVEVDQPARSRPYHHPAPTPSPRPGPAAGRRPDDSTCVRWRIGARPPSLRHAQAPAPQAGAKTAATAKSR